jgi:hypothetical protein
MLADPGSSSRTDARLSACRILADLCDSTPSIGRSPGEHRDGNVTWRDLSSATERVSPRRERACFRNQCEEDAAMNTLIESAKAAGTDGERSLADHWRDEGPVDGNGGSDIVRSVLPILVGSVAVGIAAVAIVGVQIGRRRKSKTLLRRAAAHAEDARDALMRAAAELPARGKAAIRRVRR